MKRSGDHAAFVDAWFDRGRDRSSDVVVRRLQAALRVVWDHTSTMLGEITLAAIAERVVWNAASTFPVLSTLEVDSGHGIVCDGLLAHLRPEDEAQLAEGARFILAELLAVLGNLTADLLTSELRAELTKIESLGVPSDSTGGEPVGGRSPKESAGNGSGSATS